jgi:glycosyltransferase involved in cell wall biosynthesis
MEQKYGHKHRFTRMVEKQERKIIRNMDHIFVCSLDDKEIFENRYGVSPSRLSIVPNGVNVSEVADVSEMPPVAPEVEDWLGDSTALFFMGKLDYEPNKDALMFMHRIMLPELEERAPGRFKLIVCGKPVPRGKPHPNMRFLGSVPDIRPYLHRADICVAPLTSGSGTRLKILEFLAAKKPVVASPKAVEGIACAYKVHAVIDEPQAFSRHILSLAEDLDEARAMGQRGHDLVKLMYDWSNIKPQWSVVANRMIEESAFK